jgi:hypothetical protein
MIFRTRLKHKMAFTGKWVAMATHTSNGRRSFIVPVIIAGDILLDE